MYEKFDTLVVEPDISARMRLKQATTSVPTFGKVHQVSTFHEGNDRLGGADPLDVVFISAVFPQEEISNFIKRAKETKNGQDCAYVLVLKTQNQEGSTVAKNMLVGADGLLFEPYSVDALVDITRLASTVKGERAQAREIGAIRFLMNEIIETVSTIAHLKAMKLEIGRQMKKLRDLCAIFDTLDENKKRIYLEIAVEQFEKAPLPPPLPNVPKYAGVSGRVRRKLEDKIVSKLQTKAAGA